MRILRRRVSWKRTSIVDIDASGKLVGIELLFVSDYLRPEEIQNLTITELPASA